MKKMKFLTVIMAAILVASVSFTGCEEDNTTKEPQIGLNFNTVTTALSLTDFKSTQQVKELFFATGFITLKSVEFQVERENDSIDVQFDLDLNTKIDFATGETNPDISFAEIPAGTYNSYEIEIELQDEGDSPGIILNGTYVDAEGISHDVRFEFNSGESFEVEKEGVITFSTNASAIAQVTFDPTVWFAEVSNEQLSLAIKDINGVIVISENLNVEIFDVVADGLDLATEVEMVIN